MKNIRFFLMLEIRILLMLQRKKCTAERVKSIFLLFCASIVSLCGWEITRIENSEARVEFHVFFCECLNGLNHDSVGFEWLKLNKKWENENPMEI